jgi:hypothetical protein
MWNNQKDLIEITEKETVKTAKPAAQIGLEPEVNQANQRKALERELRLR